MHQALLVSHAYLHVYLDCIPLELRVAAECDLAGGRAALPILWHCGALPASLYRAAG